jgi:succinyl-diaminopimelate desuccinylase
MQGIVRDLFRKVDQERNGLIQMTQELIRIPSVNPPGNERPVAELAAEHLKGLGFRVQFLEAEPKRTNVIGSLKGKSKSLRLCAYAHMDVVPPGARSAWDRDPFSGAIVGGKIYGRGSLDHKFAISALIYGVKAVLDTAGGLDGSLTVVFAADEETGSQKGLKYVLEKGAIRADMGLYPGPTSYGKSNNVLGLRRENVITASQGLIIYRLKVRGRTSHMMNLEAGVNAIEKAALLITKLQELIRDVNQRHDPLTGKQRMSVNLIRGGLGEGTVPDSCEITITRFIAPSQSIRRASIELKRVVEQAKKEDPGLFVEIEETQGTPSAATPSSSTLVKVIQEAGAAVRGRRPYAVGIPSFTDMGWFQHYLGVPTAMFGYGDLAHGHEANENISITDLVDSAKAYSFIVHRLLNKGPKR